jgi:glycerate dehydrogenase
MKNAVFLNASKLDFDGKLDFSPITSLTQFTRFDSSAEDEILKRVQGQEIVITKELPVGKDIISAFPDTVKLMIEAGTGYNNIDIAAARAKNLTVCNIPAYSSEAVAQLAIALMLNLSSSLHIQQRMLLGKNYDNFTKHLMVPHFEIQGKTLGLIGGGAIGKQVIKTALALGMKVLVCDPSPKAGEDKNVKVVCLEEVLKNSDFITLHCPLTPDTKHLINKDTLKLMKRSAYLINCARGPIVKEADIVEALNTGVIAGAALDVQEVEPPVPGSPLYDMPNLILTPHIGWKPFEARQRLIGIMAGDIQGYLSGKPINVVS